MPAFPQHDIPLIIQDRSFDTTGQLFYNLASNPQPNPTVHPFWIPEFIGDVIVVNGKTWPNLNVEPRQYRFRLLNGSNARFYDLSMNKGLQLHRHRNGRRLSPECRLDAERDHRPGRALRGHRGLHRAGSRDTSHHDERGADPVPGRRKAHAGRHRYGHAVHRGGKLPSGLPNTAIAAGTALRAATNPIQPIINGT